VEAVSSIVEAAVVDSAVVNSAVVDSVVDVVAEVAVVDSAVEAIGAAVVVVVDESIVEVVAGLSMVVESMLLMTRVVVPSVPVTLVVDVETRVAIIPLSTPGAEELPPSTLLKSWQPPLVARRKL
jgi:hypothetical protein